MTRIKFRVFKIIPHEDRRESHYKNTVDSRYLEFDGTMEKI